MSYSIRSPRFSFVQFDQADNGYCLPVFEIDDVWFQFVVQADTEAEADDLCDISNSSIQIGTRLNCTDVITPFTSKFERYRLSTLQVLYNWQHGIENIASIKLGQCFHLGVKIFGQTFCSNCFQRIAGSDLTGVVEYSNDENAFGFNYCGSGTEEDDGVIDCSPTVITFTNQSSLVIPYTAALAAKYGVIPAVQVYGYTPDGTLQDMGVAIQFDTYPPTKVIIDMGGPLSGIVKIL